MKIFICTIFLMALIATAFWAVKVCANDEDKILRMAKELNALGFVVVPQAQWDELNDQVTRCLKERK